MPTQPSLQVLQHSAEITHLVVDVETQSTLIELFKVNLRPALVGEAELSDTSYGILYLTKNPENITLHNIGTGEVAGNSYQVINGIQVSFPAIYPRIAATQVFQAFPLDIQGIEQTTEGQYPRPKLTISNLDNFFGNLCFDYNDIIGSTVTYYKTFSHLLEAGITAPPVTFIISQKTTHTPSVLQFELRYPEDKENQFMPKNQMLRGNMNIEVDNKANVTFPGLGLNGYIG